MEHICPNCGAPLQIAKSRLMTEEGSADIFVERKWVCVNGARDSDKNLLCSNYCGRDLNNPRIIVEVEKAIVEQ